MTCNNGSSVNGALGPKMEVLTENIIARNEKGTEELLLITAFHSSFKQS